MRRHATPVQAGNEEGRDEEDAERDYQRPGNLLQLLVVAEERSDLVAPIPSRMKIGEAANEDEELGVSTFFQPASSSSLTETPETRKVAERSATQGKNRSRR